MFTDRSSEPASTNFFKNYNRLVGVTYVSILALTFCFFLLQMYRNYNDEVHIISGHVNRHAQFIEFTLRSSVNQLEALRISASEYYTDAAGKPASSPHSPLFGKLRQDGPGFNLDAAPDRDLTGNLTGVGTLAVGSDKVHVYELEEALLRIAERNI